MYGPTSHNSRWHCFNQSDHPPAGSTKKKSNGMLFILENVELAGPTMIWWEAQRDQGKGLILDPIKNPEST